MPDEAGWANSSAPYVVPQAHGASDAWTREAARHGAKGTNRLTFAGRVPAPAFVAQVFGLNDGDPVALRRRVVYLDDAPVEVASTYYPLRIAAGTALEGDKKIRGGAITLLAELGYETVDLIEDEVNDPPDESVRTSLPLGTNERVRTLRRINLDHNGQPFQVEFMTASSTESDSGRLDTSTTT